MFSLISLVLDVHVRNLAQPPVTGTSASRRPGARREYSNGLSPRRRLTPLVAANRYDPHGYTAAAREVDAASSRPGTPLPPSLTLVDSDPSDSSSDDDLATSDVTRDDPALEAELALAAQRAADDESHANELAAIAAERASIEAERAVLTAAAHALNAGATSDGAAELAKERAAIAAETGLSLEEFAAASESERDRLAEIAAASKTGEGPPRGAGDKGTSCK